MFLIAGLGNPGAEYSDTRHNVGFRLIESLSSRLSVSLKTGKGSFLSAKTSYNNIDIVLLQPTTFMNNSGDALQQAASWYKIPAENCLVCYDDLNLDVGAIRIRRDGSAGGHNGIKDIIKKLSTDQFPRLRMGIGSDFREGEQIKYVLSRFSKEQQIIIDEAIDRAVEAAFSFISEGVETTMNNYN